MAEEPSNSSDKPQKKARTTGTGTGGWLPDWMPFGKAVPRTERPVVSTEEVFALLKYAAETGVEDECLAALTEEIHQSEPSHSKIAALYARLAAKTKPINGRTLVDSREEGFTRLKGISTVTAVFFILAVGNYIMDNWVADIVEPEEGTLLFWLNVKRYVWDYLTPFFWGALGACVFLMKRVQDTARDNVYEHHQMQGWATRILIGGVLAAIVLIIFDPSAFTAETVPLAPAAIAFLTGLGVKAVYGGLERLIEEVAAKFSVEGLRRARPTADQSAPSGE